MLVSLGCITRGNCQQESVEYTHWASTSIPPGVSGVIWLKGMDLTFIPNDQSLFYRNNHLIKEITIPISSIQCIRRVTPLPIQQTGLVIKLKDGKVYDFYMFGGKRRLIRLVRAKQRLAVSSNVYRENFPVSIDHDSILFDKKVNLLLHNLNYVGVPVRGNLLLSNNWLTFWPANATRGHSQNDWVKSITMQIKGIKNVRRNWGIVLPFRLRVKMENGRVYRFGMYGERKKLIELVEKRKAEHN